MPNYFGQTQIILGNSRGDTRLLRCQMRISWRSITRGQTAGGGDRGGTDISGDTVRSRGHQSFGDNAGHPGPASTGWEQDWHTHTSPGVGREAESHLGSFLGWYHTPGMRNDALGQAAPFINYIQCKSKSTWNENVFPSKSNAALYKDGALQVD